MPDHVYKIVEIVGSSEKGIEPAIDVALAKADESLRNLRWFEVVQIRGHIEEGQPRHYQVTIKAGFTIED